MLGPLVGAAGGANRFFCPGQVVWPSFDVIVGGVLVGLAWLGDAKATLGAGGPDDIAVLSGVGESPLSTIGVGPDGSFDRCTFRSTNVDDRN